MQYNLAFQRQNAHYNSENAQNLKKLIILEYQFYVKCTPRCGPNA